LETTPDQPILEAGRRTDVDLDAPDRAIVTSGPASKSENAQNVTFRPMRWLWIYLLIAAFVLPILLLKPIDGAIEVLLLVVLISLIALGIESEMRPAGFGRALRAGLGGLSGIRRPGRMVTSHETVQLDSSDDSSVTAEDKAKALERERLLFMAISVVLAVIAAFLYNRSTNRLENWQGATGFMLASFAAMGATVMRWRELEQLVPVQRVPAGETPSDTVPAAAVSTIGMPPFAEPTAEALSPARSNAGLTALGVAFLLILAEINGQAFDLPVLKGAPYWLQAFLFYGGMTLTALGLGGVTLRLPEVKWPRREVWLLLALFIFAFAVRLHQLDWLRASFDEAIPINAIVNIWNPSDSVGIVTQPSSYVTTLVFSQWQALAISIVGKNIIGLRIFSVVIGALSVVGMTLLARDLFDKRTGWIAGLLLAVFPPHVHFSRIALLHIADPVCGSWHPL
jgi:hypothetical protein